MRSNYGRRLIAKEFIEELSGLRLAPSSLWLAMFRPPYVCWPYSGKDFRNELMRLHICRNVGVWLPGFRLQSIAVWGCGWMRTFDRAVCGSNRYYIAFAVTRSKILCIRLMTLHSEYACRWSWDERERNDDVAIQHSWSHAPLAVYSFVRGIPSSFQFIPRKARTYSKPIHSLAHSVALVFFLWVFSVLLFLLFLLFRCFFGVVTLYLWKKFSRRERLRLAMNLCWFT